MCVFWRHYLGDHLAKLIHRRRLLIPHARQIFFWSRLFNHTRGGDRQVQEVQVRGQDMYDGLDRF